MCYIFLETWGKIQFIGDDSRYHNQEAQANPPSTWARKLLTTNIHLEILPELRQCHVIGLPDLRRLASPLPVHLVVGQHVHPPQWHHLDILQNEPLHKYALFITAIEKVGECLRHIMRGQDWLDLNN